ncbi:MAG: aspartate aminotransferase family protein [Bacteroidota bacterium]|nr:aspartate aminotransferase family protein [Bacteroidota bacterium]MDX5429434.1 aspartate aminotransferase family protein [Bacteroidota bacterium]MDX5468225.1 aspartate aminotransferase family protein [Bacteroidota bacterium]
MLTQRQLFLRHVAQTSDAPLLLEIERAEGVYLFDKNGQALIDLISGISVSSLGHGNPAVIEAIKAQSEKHLHLMVYGELVQSPQVELAHQLCSLLPSHLDSVYFVNSGSEAVEGALKLAKRFTGRKSVIAMKQAYHGSTHGALSLMDAPEYREKFGPLLPHIGFVSFNDLAGLSLITEETAAVFVETVQGEAGYLPADLEYLHALRERCTETGTLLVFDEIQCGMGRTGKFMAFEHYGVEPDILLLAKAFGAGLPLGAFVSSQKIMQCLTHDPVLGHITTFGGHPLSCAAALAGLNYLIDSNLLQSIAHKEWLFRNLLKHPKILNISGRGMMLALQFASFEENKSYIDACIKKGLLTDWFLFAPDKMRIAPPLTINEQEIEKACEIILEVLDAE